ncbi:Non-ribosomal peptide synthetase, terminal component [Sterolibacterium denitrificans]|uniref:Non-ribosomal peptide synthetase, terminal component n=1 Tax=Sterolibacterium denitrificans TaxID=157592 RepID=A0A7Z7HRY9_9PROT|nr:non-ribosomal peptide synthetase [Sterolibacterium denitrificans]SMB27154.1 Non-ribosomal peptide synthetase, terminal component [Sterolibacterium denitrificans]
MTENADDRLAALKREALLRKLKKTAQPRAQAGAVPVAVPTPPGERRRPVPLSWAQQRLWFIAQMDGIGSAYHIPGAFRLRGRLDPAALQAAFDAIVARHEILRTTIRPRGENFGAEAGVWQSIAAPGEGGLARFALRRDDIGPLLKPLDGSAREAEIQRCLRREIDQPFDLARGPLIRGLLLRCDEQENEDAGAGETHVLCIVMHHIIADGWSIGVLIREFAALYAAYSRGEPNPPTMLPPLPLQYADYALWQRDEQAGERLQKQLDHWQRELAGAPALLELPTDRARPPLQSHAGASIRFRLTPQLTADLRALARRNGVTSFMLLYAGWALLLSRLSGQRDIVIGTPVANRPRKEFEPLIGCFVNTLALRVQIDPEQSLQALLAEIKRRTLAAYAHQDAPFEQVVEALKPARSMSHSPVFQVLLSLQNVPQESLALPGLQLSALEIPGSTAQFDLSLMLHEGGESIQGELQYVSDLFDAPTMARWLACYQILLAAMSAASAASQSVATLPLLDSAERMKLLADFNATQVDYAQDQTLHQHIEAQVARQPEAIAVRYGEQTLTYAELNRRANQLAHHLIDLGIQSDSLVAISLERSLEMVVGLLGILKAGGAYVPVDPSYPAERIADMLEDAAPGVMLTQHSLKGSLPAGKAQVIALDSDWARIAQQPDGNPDPVSLGLGARNLAYVIYTSGSTGRPKGAMNEHRAVVNRLRWMQDAYRLTARDRVLQKTPFSFDVSVWEFFWPLMAGAQLVVAKPQGHQDPAYLRQLIEDEGITTLHFVPSMLQAFLDFLDQPGVAASACKLRHIVCSGEELSLALQNRCLAALPQAALHNLYGPTEAAIDVTYWECRLDERQSRVPIGFPIANVRMYILDALGQPVPVGVAGEIHIGGIGVARGYLNRPELTAERFIKDPFSNDAEARLYKTGDLGRWRADGAIEYLGRNDQQVKLRGFRIELGEIEAQIARHPNVKEVAVLAREDIPGAAGDKRLVAYVTLREGEALDIDAMKAQLKTTLPDYMVPSVFVVRDVFPLSPNGKLDRKALPVPAQGGAQTREYVAPQGEVEETLARIWQELLGIAPPARIGRHDNYFDLGGHSLLIIQMLERLRQAGLAADVRAVFEHPSVAALAAWIVGAGHGGPAPVQAAPANLIPPGCALITPAMLPLVELSPAQIERIVATVPGGAANVQDIYPLAPLQEGILFHHRLGAEAADDSDAYVLPLLLAADDEQRLDAFIDALRQVVSRHDILRSAILWDGLARPVQVVYRRVELPVEEIALDPAQDALTQMQARMASRHNRLDLRHAPLLHLQCAADPHGARRYLLLRFHHIISDHYSLEIVLREVLTILAGQAARLPEPVPYRGFVAQALAREAQGQAAEAFFRSRLADIDEPTAPFGLLDVHGDGSRIEEARLALDPQLALRLRQAARELRVGAATLFHVAFGLLLARASGPRHGDGSVVFGSVLSGRLQNTLGADQVLGMFINTLPLRLDLPGRSVRQTVEHTHRELIELLRHEQVPLALAQRVSGLPAATPLFSAMLNYRHGLPAGQPGAGGLEILASQERTNYPFTVSVDDLGEGFALVAQIDRRVQPGRVNAYLQTALQALVDALEQAPQTPILELDILPAAERLQLLEGFNAKRKVCPQHRTLAERFEFQARRCPAAVAVSCDGASLSYGELNARANQLAHHLIGLGVGPDKLVALCCERGVEMIVGLLGILKAGGAYLPIDPGYPPDRIAYTLNDAQPGIILSQQALRERLPAGAAQLIALDADWPVIAVASERDPDCETSLDNLAYIIYTSGSTGRPKGVMIEHRQVTRLFDASADAIKDFHFDEHDVWTLFHSIAFDFSVWEIFGALLHGGRLVIVPQAVARDPQAFYRMLCAEGVSILNQTPSAFRQLIAAQAEVEEAHALRCVIFGGEALEMHLLRPWIARNGVEQPRLINMYGITETTVHVTWRELGRADIEDGQGSNIGRPLPDLRIYLLDERLQPVPIGVAGEIHVGGAGLARGYLNRPELTAERFIADPHHAGAGERLYRSGDLARWKADGTLEYLGRNDHQVKIRGFRIELGEIEAQLAGLDEIAEAVVIARDDHPGGTSDKRLVAYLTAKAGNQIDPAVVRERLKAVLPDYMLPAAFVVLERLPLTANGKLDRQALPAQGIEPARAYDAPQGEIEASIAAIWQELLGIAPPARIGRHDNYFDLGGHSLTAMQLAARLSQTLGRGIPVRLIFEAPTLAELAEALIEQPAERGEAGQQFIPRLQPLPDYLPLSYAQRRLWFLSQIGAAATAYHIPAALRLSGPFEPARLQAALNALVARHRPLSATLIPVAGEPMQWPGEPVAIDLPVFPAADFSAEQLAARLTAFALEPFNLETGPLLRACVHRLAAQEHVLAVVVHHIVADGWSLQLALHELLHLYQQPAAGESTLPDLPVSFFDYAVWQRRLIDGGGLDHQRRYWLARLTGELPMLQLPTDRPRPAVQSFQGGQHRQTLPAALVEQIRQRCRQQGLTPYMLLLAIYQVLLYRLTGQTDILIGTPLAGREHPQTQSLIGFFVNTLVLRCDLADDPSVEQHFQRVRADALTAYANQDYPFDLLVDQLHSRRDLARQAVFDTSFTVETASRQPLPVLENLSIRPLAIALPRAKFDLSATISFPDESGESSLGSQADAVLSFEYSSDLFDAATIARFAGYYLNLLADALAHPARRLSELRLIDETERDMLLGPQFAGLPKQYSHAISDHLAARFSEIASRQPQACALSLAGQRLSYAELEARANRLAHELVAQGVRSGQAVALCFERGFEMITAILAVLKAGACYVPIEPGQPDERLRYLLRDSGASLILSHGRHGERLESLAAAPILSLDRAAARLADQPQSAPRVDVASTDRAYVIYTSGSTGQPKGCELTHANVLRLFDACANAGNTDGTGTAVSRFRFDADQVWTLFHSYAFDFSVWEIFGALLHGGRLVIVPQEVSRSPSDFAELLAEEKVTLLSQTPSAFLRLLELAQVEADDGDANVEADAGKAPRRREKHAWAKSLTHVVFGGEVLDYASLRPWFRHRLNPQAHLINMYGITETTVHVTWREVRQSEVEALGASSNVGRPLDDLSAYILDAHLQPQPVGVAGELYVGGAGLARGYLNRPELTAQRFIAHPYRAGERLYRSGDLARWNARGEIEYLGRLDHQVKIHGYRIELGEIEARLSAHPAIGSCIVLAVKDMRTLGDRLVAWFVASETLTAGQLRSHLGTSLPDYMIPHGFHQLAEMPLTANGKIDRSRLQADLAARPQLDVPYVMPETPMEVRLAEIWSEVLGVQRIGLADNFFDLGGDSFSAYRLMTRISDELGRDLPLESIFRQQSIAAMAQALERSAAEDEEAECSLVRIQAGEPGRIPFFCAHQAGGDVLSFRALSEALGPARPFYGVQSAGRLLGESQHHTLEEMCADYLRDIRRVQPRGPYLIGGHSMGGKVAYELARQLEAAGERVGVLAILDSDIVNKNTSMLDSLMLLSETFRLGIRREALADLEPRQMMEYLLTAGKKRFARVLEIAYDMDILPRGFRTRDAEMFLNRIATNIHVSDAYLAPPIHTPVTLFLATDHTENSYLIDVAAWRQVALGGLKVIDVPGNHLNLIQRPHVQTLGGILGTLINDFAAEFEEQP